MDKKTQILIGVSGAALIGGLVYYFRAKSQQTDVLSLLKVDLKRVGSQVGVSTPKGGTGTALPIRTQTGGTTGGVRTGTGGGTQSGGQTGPNVPPEIKAPKEGGYGVQGYGQQGGQDGQGGGQMGYGGGGGDIGGYIQGYGNGYGQGYGDIGGYGLSGGDITEYGYGDQNQNQYEEPCKPTYGTGDWIMGNECLGR